MRILGVDPGFAITGFAVVDYIGNKFKLIHCGAVTTNSKESFPLRLTKIYDELTLIINEYKPDNLAVEELFFNQNVKTAMNVSQARGVVLVLGCKNNIPTFEYTPLQVKQAVCGYGRAEKKQVQKMVQTILGEKETPKLDDITDSMAVAICHAHSAKFAEKL